MEKYKIGYLTGVFDMFNINHLTQIQMAKDKCDFLVIGVMNDYEEENYKPIISFEDRLKIIEAIKYVDRVIPVSTDKTIDLFNNFQIDVIFVDNENDKKKWYKEDDKETPQSYPKIVDLSDANMYKSDSAGLDSHECNRRPSNIDKRVGYTTGVYDMFHIGHLNLLRRAKERCGYLIVGVSTDECVMGYKNKKPICTYRERSQIVSAIKYVDEVVPQNDMNKVNFLQKHHFDVMFHGDEWKGTDLYNSYETQFEKYGAVIEYLSHTEGISSSILRSKISEK